MTSEDSKIRSITIIYRFIQIDLVGGKLKSDGALLATHVCRVFRLLINIYELYHPIVYFVQSLAHPPLVDCLLNVFWLEYWRVIESVTESRRKERIWHSNGEWVVKGEWSR